MKKTTKKITAKPGATRDLARRLDQLEKRQDKLEGDYKHTNQRLDALRPSDE
jgi:chaperonin cofactor prefoldin